MADMAKMQRKQSLQQLASQEYDILVIGGGITGACIAHDAALRGLSVGLIEKDDFGGFTSSASSKLLHGGIRYLPKGQVWKVRESGREQMIFQQLAPHLVRWLPFLIPTQQGSLTKGALSLKIAMQVYGLCHLGLGSLVDDSSRKPPTGRFLPKTELVSIAPQLRHLEKLSGGQELYESHMHSSERMTLAFLKTAASNGADIANYLAATRYLEDQGRVKGVVAQDTLTKEKFSISARLVINASGPAAQALNQSTPGLDLKLKKKISGFARGVHLVTRQIHPEYALALTTRKKTEGLVSRGGRHIFILPWRGRSLIGTTNVPFDGDFDKVRVTAQDVNDFIEDINDALPDVQLTRNDVYYAFTGLYPLIVKDVQSDTYQGTGEYQLIDHQAVDGVAGVITSLGAKYTTGRNVAEKTVDMAVSRLGQKNKKCLTESTPLLEGRIDNLEQFITEKQEQYQNQLPADAVSHLILYHGAEVDKLLDMAADNPDMLKPLSPSVNTLAVEVLYAVQEEMAFTLDDVIFRRTGIGTVGRPDNTALQRTAEIMAAELDWDSQRSKLEKNQVLARYSYEQSDQQTETA